MGWLVAGSEKRNVPSRSGAEQPSDPRNDHWVIVRMRVGSGAISQNDEIIATKLGWVRESNGTVSVDPIQSILTTLWRFSYCSRC